MRQMIDSKNPSYLDSPKHCKTLGCSNLAQPSHDFCPACEHTLNAMDAVKAALFNREVDQDFDDIPDGATQSVLNFNDVDVYAVHHIFSLTDPSGCLHRASTKLLTSGQLPPTERAYVVERARNLLNRWLELNTEHSQ